MVAAGDVSGSMHRGKRMDILKKSFREVAEKQASLNAKFALAQWDSYATHPLAP